MDRRIVNEKPASLSVIIVSDYAAGGDKSWDDLRRGLRAWANQNAEPPEEFILVESTRFEGRVPRDLFEIIPDMKILYIDAESSYELKNRAVEFATGDWLAIVDADCVPQSTWLKILRATIVRYPDAAAISAKTLYPGRSRIERLLGLLSRSYLDPGRGGSTRFISGNAACFRREFYRHHPLPVGLGAFASRIQSEAFLRDGARLVFEPELVVIHDFEGWRMECDIRRNHGYSTVITRLQDHRLPYARIIRVGKIAIPFIVAGKTLHSFDDCFRCFRQYGVKAYELPIALTLAIIAHLIEIPGMLAAYRGRVVGTTAYR